MRMSRVLIGGTCVAALSLLAPSAQAKDEGPIAIAVGGGAVWVTTGNGFVSRLALEDGRRLGSPIRAGYSPLDIAVSAGAVWIANAGSGGDRYAPRNGSLTKVEASTGRVLATVHLPRASPRALAVAADSVWVVSTDDARIFRVDLRSARVTDTLKVSRNGLVPWSVAATERTVWVSLTMRPAACAKSRACRLETIKGVVVGIDPSSNKVVARRGVGAGQNQLAASPNMLWVTNAGENTVTALNASAGPAMQMSAQLPGRPLAVTTDRNAALITSSENGHSVVTSVRVRAHALAQQRLWSGPLTLDLAASTRHVWLITFNGRIIKFDNKTG
jgi:DNA-binding beta-propeller fold protein YncE